MAGKEQSSPELVEKALGSSVFDGKSSGSKRGPLRTHLGGYRSSGRSQERRATQTADGSFPEHFGDLRRVTQSMNSRGVRLRGFANAAQSSVERLRWPGDKGRRNRQRRAAPAPLRDPKQGHRRKGQLLISWMGKRGAREGCRL